MWNAHKIARLYLITDDIGRDPDTLVSLVRLALRGGVTAVQYREKTASPCQTREAVRRLAELCADFHAPLLVNSDVVARLGEDDAGHGIHFNSRTLPLHPEAIEGITAYSAHDANDVRMAFSHNVHFCTVSPVFATPSKIGILEPIGHNGITAARKASGNRALIALGGIDETNACDCIRSGADGIAVMRAIMSAGNPKAASERLRCLVDEALAEREREKFSD